MQSFRAVVIGVHLCEWIASSRSGLVSSVLMQLKHFFRSPLEKVQKLLKLQRVPNLELFNGVSAVLQPSQMS